MYILIKLIISLIIKNLIVFKSFINFKFLSPFNLIFFNYNNNTLLIFLI